MALVATPIDLPSHDIVLKDEWLVPCSGKLDCRWTLREEVIALCHYAHLCGGNVLEIGCNEGNTTAALAFNNPDRHIFAVDWTESPVAMVPEQRGECPDVLGKHARGFANVDIINADSSTIIYQPSWNIRMVFIDGGHHYAQVKQDTERAIEYLQAHAGGYVLWHDYGDDRPDWVEVAQYLDREIAPYYNLRVVKGTALALIRVKPTFGSGFEKITALELERTRLHEHIAAMHGALVNLENELACHRAELAHHRERWETLRASWLWSAVRPFRGIVQLERRLRLLFLNANTGPRGAGFPERAEANAALSRCAQLILTRLMEVRSRTAR